MASPPALPPCAKAGISGGGIGTTGAVALPCGLSIPIPKLLLPSIVLPPIPFPPTIPFPPNLGLKLNCDLKNPISITAGLPASALRVPCFDVSDDDAEAA